MASWQAHGAGDGLIAPMPSVPLVIPAEPSVLDQDWMLDLLVLWRWRGQAPESPSRAAATQAQRALSYIGSWWRVVASCGSCLIRVPAA